MDVVKAFVAADVRPVLITFMVTKFPNHWCASSCETTVATRCLKNNIRSLGMLFIIFITRIKNSYIPWANARKRTGFRLYKSISKKFSVAQ